MAEGYRSPATLALEESQLALQDALARHKAAGDMLAQRSGEASPDMLAKLQADAAAAEAAAQRAEARFRNAYAMHPVNVYRRIHDDSERVTAPELSTFQWWAQNPGFLTSVAKNQKQRNDDARQDFVLTRLHEEASKAKHPYSLYDEDATASHAMLAAQYADDPQSQAALRGPYLRSAMGESQLPGAASLGERAAETTAGALATALGPEHSWANLTLDLLARPQHFATGFRAAGQRLAEGNPYGAAMGAAQAFTGMFDPATAVRPAEFHKYAPPAISDALNDALDPLWYTGAGKAAERLRYGQGIPAYLESASGALIKRLPNVQRDPGASVRILLQGD